MGFAHAQTRVPRADDIAPMKIADDRIIPVATDL